MGSIQHSKDGPYDLFVTVPKELAVSVPALIEGELYDLEDAWWVMSATQVTASEFVLVVSAAGGADDDD
jgi:hypothetical protein